LETTVKFIEIIVAIAKYTFPYQPPDAFISQLTGVIAWHKPILTIRQGGTAPPITALSVQRLTFWHQADIDRKMEESFAKRFRIAAQGFANSGTFHLG
jgi:hypothetical protein